MEIVPTVTMEEIADDWLYFWHTFFSIAGCNNDLTVFDRSPVVSMILNAIYPITCEKNVEDVSETSRAGYEMEYTQSIRAFCIQYWIQQTMMSRTTLHVKREEEKT